MTDEKLQELLALNPINPKYGVPVPLIMECNVTGVRKKYTAPEYIKNKIDGAGGLKQFLSTYVGRGCNKDGVKSPTKASIVSSTPRAPVTPVTPVKIATETQDKQDTITRVYLYDRFGENDATVVQHPRQSPEQLPINVHDNRKNKMAKFDSSRVCNCYHEILKNNGISLK